MGLRERKGSDSDQKSRQDLLSYFPLVGCERKVKRAFWHFKNVYRRSDPKRCVAMLEGEEGDFGGYEKRNNYGRGSRRFHQKCSMKGMENFL